MHPTTKQAEAHACDSFFNRLHGNDEAVTFDGVLLKPNSSNVLPGTADTSGYFTRNIWLPNAIVSSPMDTVTEWRMAIGMALNGGLGIIHKAMTPEEQGKMVTKVKYHLNAFIPNPITVRATATIAAVEAMIQKKNYGFRSFPVKGSNGKIIGIVTSKDFEFGRYKKKISEIMSTKLKSAPSGINAKQAFIHMAKNGKDILPLFDESGKFKGIFTIKDVVRTLDREEKKVNKYALDSSGRLLVGAAVGVNLKDLAIRMKILVKAKVDVVVVDSAHGNTRNVETAVKWIKKNYPQIDIMAGNIIEGSAALRLIAAGADGVRVGIGGGSICTTRDVSGTGFPQVSAIFDCAYALRDTKVPVCGDGGIRNTGDMMKAFAAGANTIMLGSLLAGTDETPGEERIINGKTIKDYRGMGSLEAMVANQASRERYSQDGKATEKMVAEGVSAFIDYRGKLADVMVRYLGGIQSGMGYNGAKDIDTLHKIARFTRVFSDTLNENHPHDVILKQTN